jgi:hypothetical protein
MKILEFKRSGIGSIAKFRGIPNGFPNQVKAAVGGNLLLSVFDNVFVRDYLAQLNPKHRPPY